MSAFDSESRTEIREQQGLLALSNCLSSDNWRVQEEALMALANCAFDIPCKQTIGALGGMKNGISLLSNPADVVVGNACVALSRLVFDFMSGVDFMEQQGIQQLFTVLERYVAAYRKYRGYQDQIDAGEEVAIPEGEKAPELLPQDLLLGKNILECCKASAEQGNVREMIRNTEGFLPNMFAMIKHEDEVVSGMACQAVANACFDVAARPQLLEMDAVPEFVRCLKYKDVETQLYAARALGNIALDEVGRNKMREAGALPELVEQLHAMDENGKDAIEPRRAAILAMGKCAWDRTSAVELCDIGALRELLQLMETHWKQLGEAASDSVERLLAQSQSAKVWLRGEVQYEDVTSDGWYDMIGDEYYSIEVLQCAPVDREMEVLLADTRKDKKLAAMVKKCKDAAVAVGLTDDMSDRKDSEAIETKQKVVKMISSLVGEAMGGSVSYEDYNDWGYAAEIARCKELRRSNVIWVGDMRRGVCRHRAFLFKFLCDQVVPGLAR